MSNVPLLVDYSSGSNPPGYPRRRRMRASLKAARFVGVAVAVGLVIGDHQLGSKMGFSILAIPFVWAGAAWYVGARVAESNAADFIKAIKGWTGVIATLIAPFLLCGSSAFPSVLMDVMKHGWDSKFVGDGGRAGFQILFVLLGIFAIADVVDLIMRWRSRSKG